MIENLDAVDTIVNGADGQLNLFREVLFANYMPVPRRRRPGSGHGRLSDEELSDEERNHSFIMPKCERCKVNDARIRLDQNVAGKLVHHYFCESCAREIMGEMNGG